MTVGTFIEEVIAPIPSFVVLVPAGAAAQAQDAELWYLLVLSVFSGVGRVAGGAILYWLADKFEDVLFAHGRRFFGVSHKDVEGFGKKIGGRRKRDWWLLFFMNAFPLFPGAALSLAYGFVKVPFRTFVSTTFFGTLVSGFFYLYVGYAGLQAIAALVLHKFEVAMYVTIGLIVLLAVGWYVVRWLRPKRAARAAQRRR